MLMFFSVSLPMARKTPDSLLLHSDQLTQGLMLAMTTAKAPFSYVEPGKHFKGGSKCVRPDETE